MPSYADYNLIPIGDHCAIAMLLKDLGLRNKSYPFDWVAHTDGLYHTNIINNVDIISRLYTYSIHDIVKEYIGDAFENNKVNSTTNNFFPHETGSLDEIVQKYERRFDRLKHDLANKAVFILLTRHYFIERDVFQSIIERLLQFNRNSVILFISGTDHPYFAEMQSEHIIFKYIHYDVSKYYDYDYSSFRPAVRQYLAELLR